MCPLRSSPRVTGTAAYLLPRHGRSQTWYHISWAVGVRQRPSRHWESLPRVAYEIKPAQD